MTGFLHIFWPTNRAAQPYSIIKCTNDNVLFYLNPKSAIQLSLNHMVTFACFRQNPDNHDDNGDEWCVLTRLDRAFRGAYVTNGFSSVSRGDFEMRTEAVPPKLSQEAPSIASSDTSKIGPGKKPAHRRRHPRQPFCCIDQLQRKEQRGTGVVSLRGRFTVHRQIFTFSNKRHRVFCFPLVKNSSIHTDRV